MGTPVQQEATLSRAGRPEPGLLPCGRFLPHSTDPGQHSTASASYWALALACPVGCQVQQVAPPTRAVSHVCTPHVFMCLCICICLSFCVWISLCMCVLMCLSLCVCISECLPTCVCLCACILVCLCISECVPTCVRLCPCVCRWVCSVCVCRSEGTMQG